MSETLETKIRTARKPHTCDYCGGVIEIGEKYDWAKLVHEGELYEWKAHKECASVASELWDYADPDDGMTSDDFSEACRDFCVTFVCPGCEKYDKESGDCEDDEYYCVGKIAEHLRTHNFRRCKDRPYAFECVPKEPKGE